MKELTFLVIGFGFGALWMKGRRDGLAMKVELESLRNRHTPTA